MPDNRGTGTNESIIFILETSSLGVFVAERQSAKMERLAKTSSQEDNFDVFEDTTLVLKDPLRMWALDGIIPPTP